MSSLEPHGNETGFAEQVSDFLFRQRKIIFISILLIVLGAVSWGIYIAISSQRNQAAALAVYELRRAFQEWQDAHPENLLTAEKNLEGSDEALDIDEETQREREETEKTLNEMIQENLQASSKHLQAWAYWIEARKARHLKNNTDFQAALNKLLALEDKTFHNLATLQLAGLLYSEGKMEEAVARWRILADVSVPTPAQIIASVYLGNYFARSGKKEEAIRYWQQVESLGDELLQANSGEDAFLGGDNLIVTNFRDSWKQWKIMAENQLLFLQSNNIQIEADQYDETIKPVEPAPPEEGEIFSFTTGAAGSAGLDLGKGLPGTE
ncbi:MAG: hypothetical protein AAF975_00205 [Spirochaetota bacterium]